MQIGPYQTVRELGRGGMGVVYEARAAGASPVAIKVVHRRAAPEARERFRREQRLLASLGRELGFVPVLDAGDSEHGPYLVMPLLVGGSLRDRLDQGALDFERGLSLGLGITEAVGHAHERGIVHRDLKPENILFAQRGNGVGGWGPPLVADLGLAKHFTADAPGASQSVNLTRSGEMKGTVGYMAPEQLVDAAHAGPAADVFALGAMLYECFSGKAAFTGASALELLVHVETGHFEPLARACPTVPRAVAQVVERALAKKPEDRFLDARELTRALRESARAPEVAPARRPWRWLVALLLIACTVTTASFLAVQSSRERRARDEQEAAAAARLARERAEQERAAKLETARLAREKMEAAGLPRGLRRGQRITQSGGRELQIYLWKLPGQAGAMELVLVPAGDYILGTDEARLKDAEHPRHHVIFDSAFWIGRYDVTWRQFLDFVKATGATVPPRPYGAKDDHPASGIALYEAISFCQWAGVNLPTCVEWERAARGTDGREWPWGSTFDAANCCSRESGALGTAPVGSFPGGIPPTGALDMAGNVWQWCVEPIRVRGCGWNWTAQVVPSADAWNVSNYGADDRVVDIGFRVVVRTPSR